VAPVSKAIDEMFRNAPQRTKTESQQAFQLSFVSSLGNVKAFILGHLRGGGLYHFAGLGQHHGDVDSSANA
jgi:hypothetical protein